MEGKEGMEDLQGEAHVLLEAERPGYVEVQLRELEHCGVVRIFLLVLCDVVHGLQSSREPRAWYLEGARHLLRHR